MSAIKNTRLTCYTNIKKPSSWPKYKKGMCDTCMAGCCMLIIEVTHDDLIRLKLTDAWEIENCLKDLIKRLKKLKIIKRYNSKNGKFIFGKKKSSDCIFLDNNRRCMEYKNRPEVCRNHPVIVSPKKGFCPYIPK